MNMPTKIVKRTLPDGSEQQYERQQKKISDGAQQTGHALIMYYAAHYRTSTLELNAADVPEGLRSDGIPSLKTNGELLAKFRENICSRTSRTHIKQLMELGLITKKVFHGSKSRYELFFNTDILFGKDAVIGTPPPTFATPNTTNPGLAFDAQKSVSSSENRTKFPHRQSLETNGNKTTTIMNVENSTEWKHLNENSTEWIQNNGNTPVANPEQRGVEHGNGGLAAGPQKIYSAWSKYSTNVDNIAKNVDNYVDNSKKVGMAGFDFERQHRVIQNSILIFWKYANQQLYTERKFSENEFLRSVDLILDSIYRPFLKTKPNEKEFNEFQKELLASIDVAAKYFQNHPDKYPGQPYTTSDSYLGYFDVKNLRGFRVAVNWRFQNKAKQHDEYGKRVVNVAMLHLNRFATNDIEKLPKHLRSKSFREVYDHYKNKMMQFNSETQLLFVKRFNALTFKK